MSSTENLVSQRVKIVDSEDERDGQTGVIVLVFVDEYEGEQSVCFLLTMDKDAMFYEVYATNCQLHSTRVY